MKANNGKNIVYTTFFLLISVIFIRPASALPPDPDNPALLYYQAFLIYEKPDETMREMVENLAKGRIEPNPTITKYIENCRPAIELAESAGELTLCDWGVKYSDGLDAQVSHLGQVRMLTHIILADARTALSQDNYDLAIQRCLTARKLGIDVGQDPLTVGFLVEKSIERITNKCIQEILSSRAMEPQALQQLKAKLDELDGRIKPLQFFLKTEREVTAMYITTERIRELLPWIEPGKETGFVYIPENMQKYIINADKEFCQGSLNYYNQYWQDIFSAIELPYRQAYTRLEELGEKPRQDCKTDPYAVMTALLAPALHKIYGSAVQNETFSNALRTALEIYEIFAQTGRLPHSLPAGMPKDLFSNEEFEYKKTDDGFILRCRGKDLKEDTIYEYEFNVQQ